MIFAIHEYELRYDIDEDNILDVAITIDTH
jgi:hypothetical protein